MNRIIVIIIAFLGFVGSVGAILPYQRTLLNMDNCKLGLLPPNVSKIDFEDLYYNNPGWVYCISDSRINPPCTPDMNHTNQFNFWIINGVARNIYDRRNYTTYYIDYPLGISIKDAGDYTFYCAGNHVGRPDLAVNSCVTLLYLYDKKVSDTAPIANLLEGGVEYSFTITPTEVASGVIQITNRFFVRMIAAYLSTENYEGMWNDADSWQGGIIPGSSSAVPNSHVIINESSIIRTSSSDNFTTGFLTNYGYLENNGSLKFNEGVELMPPAE